MTLTDRSHKEKYVLFLLAEYRRLRFSPKEREGIFRVPVSTACNLSAYKIPGLNDQSLGLLYHVFKSKRVCVFSRCEIILNVDLIHVVHIDGIYHPLKFNFSAQVNNICDTESTFDKKPVYIGTISNGERFGFTPEQNIIYAVGGFVLERGGRYTKVYLKL